MISGVVNAQNETTVRITIHDVGGVQHDIGTVVDTGFTGAITLPPSTIAA